MSNRVVAKDVMTPLHAVFSMNENQTLESLLSAAAADAFSRIPIFDASPVAISGYLSHRDAFKAAALGTERLERSARFKRTMSRVPVDMPVENVLEFIPSKHEAFAVVESPSGVAGPGALEDLFGAILDMEITDEAESIGQLRPGVSSYRKARLERLRGRQAGEMD